MFPASLPLHVWRRHSFIQLLLQPTATLTLVDALRIHQNVGATSAWIHTLRSREVAVALQLGGKLEIGPGPGALFAVVVALAGKS